MADRTSQERNFSVGIPALLGSRSRRIEHSSQEGLRLIALCHYTFFVAILSALLPQVLMLMGLELASTVSSIGLFILFLLMIWLLVGSILNVTREIEEGFYDAR